MPPGAIPLKLACVVSLIGGAIVLAGIYVGVTLQTREGVAESVSIE